MTTLIHHMLEFVLREESLDPLRSECCGAEMGEVKRPDGSEFFCLRCHRPTEPAFNRIMATVEVDYEISVRHGEGHLVGRKLGPVMVDGTADDSLEAIRKAEIESRDYWLENEADLIAQAVARV